ncbi:predicted protein [Uncinocarpus reesii 1704]|uniref:Uncharacterized protein n=1 Tax=Uncinocarpus reesii (strain UAMH 1704) TaxID=336963 RepID=C4JSH0_UNCRE|nr:uncharacterized protein UREG_05409 [Uncinocarpus reesii 1704]EEP80567.1 predicted protein [Uncinocarpus reesii 1704]
MCRTILPRKRCCNLQQIRHGEAAVMLQRGWNHDPQKLPFAPYIKTHGLVTLIQKGLQYYDLEKSVDKNGNSVSPNVSFFGPGDIQTGAFETAQDSTETKETTIAGNAEPMSTASAGTTPRIDGEIKAQTPTASVPTVNPRDGEASELEKAATKADGVEMEVDRPEQIGEPSLTPRPPFSPATAVVDADGDVGMIESQEQEPQTPIFTLTTGQSVGVQVSPIKAADLGPETALIDALGESHVMRTAWRPNDPLTFAAAGDTFCGLWKLSGQRPSTPPTRTTLVTSSCVTAMDWDSTGEMLAVATYDNFFGTITMYDASGTAVDVLPESPRLVSGLRWAEKGSQVAIVACDGERSELFLWSQESRPDSLINPEIIDRPIYDVVWCTSYHIFACGDGFIYQCNVGENIQVSKTFTSGEKMEPWTLLKTLSTNEMPIAVAASTSTAHIWIPTHDIHVETAHHGDITGLEIRPRQKSIKSSVTTSFTVATSSMDDTVKLWNVDLNSKVVQCHYRLFLGAASPALALSFTPDGYAIAAASYTKLSIWCADRGGTPMATWDAASEKPTDEANQEGPMELDLSDESMMDRPLSWDSDGKKLALGFGRKMAIINLQR